jgi:hypothetical protein
VVHHRVAFISSSPDPLSCSSFYFICVIVIGALFLRFPFWALCFWGNVAVAVTFARTKKVERWPFSFVVSTYKQVTHSSPT